MPKLNLPLVITVLTAIAGAVGTVLVPVFGQSLSTAVQAVLQAVVGLLVVIPTYHVSSVATVAAKSKAAARYAPK